MSEHAGHRKRLRERADKTGLTGFQPHEVLELLLMETIPRKDVNPLAHALIEHFGSFSAVLDAAREDLMQVDGVGERTADHLSSLPHLFAYYSQDRWERSSPTLVTPGQACEYCISMFGRQREESFGIVCLDAQRSVIARQILSRGTVDEAPAYPRMVAEAALRYHAHSVIMVHNHPSGMLVPSEGDLAVSEQIGRALAALEIHLVDHVIVAGPRAVSLVQAGFIHRGGTRVEKRPQLQVHRSDAKAADLSPDRLH